MRVKLLMSFVAVAGFVAAGSLSASAEEATAAGIKSQSPDADAQRH